MGTWSKPLFATVSPGTPEDYCIDISEFSEDTLCKWKHTAFFDCETKESYTLSEFMDTGCDSHRIMDYMNNEQIHRWTSLFAYLSKKYPTLTKCALHFYCSDERKPYYFAWDRTKHGAEPRHFSMHVGYPDSIHYFTIENDPENSRKQLLFREELYSENWRKMPHEVYELTIRSFG
jgi:hypothetical protein